MSLSVKVSTSSVVASSNHRKLFQFTDSAVTSVVVGRSLSFKSSSFRIDLAVMVVVEQCFASLYLS